MNDGFVTCSNGLYTLVFKIQDNDTIVLQIPNQDGLHMNGQFIPNGTEFYYEEPSRGTLTFHAEPASANPCVRISASALARSCNTAKVWGRALAKRRVRVLCAVGASESGRSAPPDFCVHKRERGRIAEGELSVQADTTGETQQVFEMPEDMHGFGFNSYDDGEELPLCDTEELVLASLIPDLGAGVRMFDCQSLSADPVLYQDASCALVVKAVFGTASSLR